MNKRVWYVISNPNILLCSSDVRLSSHEILPRVVSVRGTTYHTLITSDRQPSLGFTPILKLHDHLILHLVDVDLLLLEPLSCQFNIICQAHILVDGQVALLGFDGELVQLDLPLLFPTHPLRVHVLLASLL